MARTSGHGCEIVAIIETCQNITCVMTSWCIWDCLTICSMISVNDSSPKMLRLCDSPRYEASCSCASSPVIMMLGSSCIHLTKRGPRCTLTPPPTTQQSNMLKDQGTHRQSSTTLLRQSPSQIRLYQSGFLPRSPHRPQLLPRSSTESLPPSSLTGPCRRMCIVSDNGGSDSVLARAALSHVPVVYYSVHFAPHNERYHSTKGRDMYHSTKGHISRPLVLWYLSGWFCFNYT